jgi:hypothetical protein
MITPSPLGGEGWGEGNLHIGAVRHFPTDIFIGNAGIILYIIATLAVISKELKATEKS